MNPIRELEMIARRNNNDENDDAPPFNFQVTYNFVIIFYENILKYRKIQKLIYQFNYPYFRIASYHKFYLQP